VPALLPAFAAASTLLILAPGPDSLQVVRNTVRGGRRAGWVTASGTLSGLLVWAVAAALGLSELLRVSRVGSDVLRLGGAAYLIWLGVNSLGFARRRQAAPAAPTRRGGAENATAGPPGWGHAYRAGLLCNLFNPKIGVFFIAFLPGFLPRGAATAQFSLALGLWLIAGTGAWLAVLAWLTAHGLTWLRRPAVRRWLERLAGIVLIGFGLKLVTGIR
jgi:threonine/homoserine/homoserine lactone efflux protein